MENDFTVFDDAYGYDEELAKGKWFTIRGIKVKLAYAHTTYIEGLVEDRRIQMGDAKGDELTTEDHEKIGNQVFSEYLVLDWKVKGMPCNPENVLAVCKKYPAFSSDCMAICHNNKQFQEERIEATVEK